MARITTNEGKESHITGKVEQTENITGWWFQPLWKILVKWDYCSKYMEKKQMFQTTNQIISSVKQARKSESHWRQTSLNIYETSGFFQE